MPRSSGDAVSVFNEIDGIESAGKRYQRDSCRDTEEDVLRPVHATGQDSHRMRQPSSTGEFDIFDLSDTVLSFLWANISVNGNASFAHHDTIVGIWIKLEPS